MNNFKTFFQKFLSVFKSKDTVVMTTIILFLICAVVAAANAVTNKFTKGKIEELAENQKKEAMAQVVPADNYNEKTVKKEDKEYTYFEAIKGGKTVGYVFTVANYGYGGDVEVMTGIGTDGKITKVKILSVADETPGLGQNATKKDFYTQFENKTQGINLVTGNVSGDNDVKALTGATYTSKAVHKDIEEAFSLYETIGKIKETADEDEETRSEEVNTDE